MSAATPHRKRIKHFDEPGHTHLLTFSCYRRRPLLTDDIWLGMLSSALDAAHERHNYDLLAFVYMPEHVHLLVNPRHGAGKIAELLKAIKRPFSFRIKKLLERESSPLLNELTIRQRPGVMTFRFWQEGPGYDRNITEYRTLERAIEYIHMNPVRRGLCERPEEFRWSSARQYVYDNWERDPGLPCVTRLNSELIGGYEMTFERRGFSP